MPNRPRQLWILKYKENRKRDHKISPPLRYPWEAIWWLKQFKPLATDITVESHRPLAIPK